MTRLSPAQWTKYVSWAEKNSCNQVYPLSIAEGIQSGDIFVDDEAAPGCVLFWHDCGFVYITGSVTEEMMGEVTNDICHREKRRFALITDEAVAIHFLERKGYVVSGRIEYDYAGLPDTDMSHAGFEIRRIDKSNIQQISGRIIPAFSWKNDRFLEYGFGYMASIDGMCCGAAFSSAVSAYEVDIGVEVNPEHRGRGMATALTCRMCEEIISQGKKPVWAHAASNTASMRTALKSGFIQKKINRYCCIKPET